jgi:hypothetical protein
MTATQLPPAAKSTMDAVREGLADIRDRVSDIEAMPDWDALAEIPGHLVDRATGRNRRPRWPFVALGVLAVVGIAFGVAMFMWNRSTTPSLEELENSEDGVWTPGGTTRKASTSHTASMAETTADSFPASDPMSSSLSPGVGPS